MYDMCSKYVHVINTKLTKHNTGIQNWFKTLQGTHHNVTRFNIPSKKSSSNIMLSSEMANAELKGRFEGTAAVCMQIKHT